MYEEYFGFVQPPFSLTPDPKFLYRSESHDGALQQVWQAIRRKEGFIVLAGDIGTGKTTLCRTILEQFDPTTFTALILNPFLTVEELLREILLSYGIASKESLRTGRLGTASKHELVRTLHDFLLSLVPIRGSAVLIIDEAQHLSPAVLEEIRILSNLETNEQKLLLVLLVGQLNLLDVLHDAQLRQLNQRISIRCLLKPLNREEVEAYITHRLQIAQRLLGNLHARSRGFSARRHQRRAAHDQPDLRSCPDGCLRGQDRQDLRGVHSRGRRCPQYGGPCGGATTRERSPLWPVDSGLVRAALFLLGVSAVAVISYVGNPRGDADLPAVAGLQTQTLRAAPPPPQPPEGRPTLMPPPAFPGSHAVIVGTYRTPQEASKVERTLRERSLPVYAIDLRYLDGVRRRLLIGRYRSRAEAEKARADLESVFTDARVAHWSEESLR